MNHDLAPHAICLLGDPGVLWTLVVTNLITAGSYFVIPFTLFGMAARQKGAARDRTQLTQWFVVACGTSHVLMVVVMFVGGGFYYLQAGVNTFMAGVSAMTAFAFWRARAAMQ